ncbi:hypothetical protein B1A_03841, partial [mine drainage metagenome]
MSDPEIVKKKNNEISTVGIDRGMRNIAVLDNNMFLNSKESRSVKRRYQYKRTQLQREGNHSAHRKLKELCR